MKTLGGSKGVHFYKSRGNYQAYINKKRKRINLGYFNDAVSAAKEYNKMALIYHGKFARLNPIPNE